MHMPPGVWGRGRYWGAPFSSHDFSENMVPQLVVRTIHHPVENCRRKGSACHIRSNLNKDNQSSRATVGSVQQYMYQRHTDGKEASL